MSHLAVAGWLAPLLLLLGSTAPAISQAVAFDLVADDGRVMDPPPLPEAAAALVQNGSPFRLLPEESVGVPVELGLESGRADADAPRGGCSLLVRSTDSSRAHRSGDQLAADDLTPLSETPCEQRASPSPAKGPDWPGIGRDTGFILGYQVIGVAILYALPGELNHWQSKDVSFDNWWHNVSRPPVWDNDPIGTNFVSHPYWGATYYIRARERGFGKLESFGYSIFLSTLYEYGAEAFFEPPSAQDLMVTPILGSLIGAFVFEPIRGWVKRKPEFQWYDQALLIATDPFGSLNSVFERMLGIKSEILLRPTPPSPAMRALGTGERDGTGPRARGFTVGINVTW